MNRAQTLRKNIVTEQKARTPEENDLDCHKWSWDLLNQYVTHKNTKCIRVGQRGEPVARWVLVQVEVLRAKWEGGAPSRPPWEILPIPRSLQPRRDKGRPSRFHTVPTKCCQFIPQTIPQLAAESLRPPESSALCLITAPPPPGLA